MSAVDLPLPGTVLRPLYRAGVAVAVFLAVVALWAGFAPLATSIPLSGRIVSAHPGVDLQHPDGGQVAEVLVRKHAPVQAGQVLIRCEDGLERDNLAAMEELRQQIRDENAIIAMILEATPDEEISATGAGAHHALRFRQLQMQRRLQERSTQSLAQQMQALDTKARRDVVHLDLLRRRVTQQEALVARGTMRATDNEVMRARMLSLEGTMLSDTARRHDLQDQLDQSRRQADLADLTLRADLAAAQNANAKHLEELQQSITTLRDRVQRTQIYAPFDGMVTEIFFEAPGMYAPRGSTLVALARPLEEPHVEFRVPPALIDQLRPGQAGQLVIPGLPQRNMPRLTLEIAALSPRAEQDEAGNPLGYSGLARLNPEAQSALQEVFGPEFALTEDMPINLMIEGRRTTLLNYLVVPFWAAFNRALQD
jgi:multidrug efflux pump subunit AcrA (membrane-fusion protein)